MLCNTCSAEIPPAFVKALERNICPSCDGPIMLEDTIELMAGIKSALEQMPNDPQGIAGWLLSNYRMQKVGSGEPTGFYGVKNGQQKGPNSDKSDLKIAENPMQKFLKNAGIDPAKQNNYALLAAQINAGEDGKDFSDLDVEESEDYQPENEDPEYTKQALKTMMNASTGKKQMQKYVEPSFDPELGDLHPALHDDRLKRLDRQKELAFGGSVGKIKRS
jgi:hypothetical protein